MFKMFPGRELVLRKGGKIMVFEVIETGKNFCVCRMEGKYNETFTYGQLLEIRQGLNPEYEWIG